MDTKQFLKEHENDIIKLANDFISKNKRYLNFYLSRDDYLHELILEVYEHIQNYNENRGAFSLFCWLCFKNNVGHKVKQAMAIKRRVKVLSMSQTIDESDSIALEDNLADPIDFEDKCIANLEYAEIIKFVKKYASNRLQDFLLNGLNGTEIGQKYGISHQAATLSVNKELKRLKLALSSNNLDILLTNYFSERERYMAEHHCSKRTYYRRKAIARNNKIKELRAANKYNTMN